jgi:hypothetical protein
MASSIGLQLHFKFGGQMKDFKYNGMQKTGSPVRQIGPMPDFFIDCYFKGFCKGRKNFVSTLRYAA